MSEPLLQRPHADTLLLVIEGCEGLAELVQVPLALDLVFLHKVLKDAQEVALHATILSREDQAVGMERNFFRQVVASQLRRDANAKSKRSCLLTILLICGVTLVATAQTCQLNSAIVNLKGQRPLEINPTLPPGTCGFLQFAWQDFVALNWPPLAVDPSNTSAQTRGLPDPSKIVGQGLIVFFVRTELSPAASCFRPSEHLCRFP